MEGIGVKLTNIIYPELNSYSTNLCLEGEEWRDVISHVGMYQVSNFGRVKRLGQYAPRKNRKPLWYPELVFKANNDSRGYPQVSLVFGVRRVARVHRLVAESFLKTPSQEILDENMKAGLDRATVNHKDENPMNSHASNLEWCTVSYNNAHSLSFDNYKNVRGADNYNSTLDEEDVSVIVQLLNEGKVSQERIAEMFGTKQVTISNIHTGRSWAWFTGRKWTARSGRKKAKSAQISLDVLDVH